jgi:hypothetical protein
MPSHSLFCGIPARMRQNMPASALWGIRCGITASLAAALLGVDVGKRADGVEDGMSPAARSFTWPVTPRSIVHLASHFLRVLPSARLGNEPPIPHPANRAAPSGLENCVH